MLTWIEARVSAVTRTWRGAAELSVDTPNGPSKALVYPELSGMPGVGDRVFLTSDATRLGLGTGGYLFVVAIPDRLPAPGDLPGHLMKARYTPMQYPVAGVDEQGTDSWETMMKAESIDGMPVVVADLHSAVPAIVAGIKHSCDATIAYVHTDTAALPVWLSMSASRLRETGDISTIITTGQSFGGDLEAVNVHSGLLAAKHVANADIAIVTQGPGNLGTGTPWGFTGTVVGDHVNAINALGGRCVATLRVSGVDSRPRHRGISHHSLRAYLKVALTPAYIPTTKNGIDPALVEEIEADYPRFGQRFTFVDVDTSGLAPVLEGLPLSTMGRSYAEDPAPFLFTGAGGILAANLLDR